MKPLANELKAQKSSIYCDCNTIPCIIQNKVKGLSPIEYNPILALTITPSIKVINLSGIAKKKSCKNKHIFNDIIITFCYYSIIFQLRAAQCIHIFSYRCT